MSYHCCARLLAPLGIAVFLSAAPCAAGRAEALLPDAPPAATEAGEPWSRLAWKTATYQAMSSFNDLVYGAVFAGGWTTGGMLAATSLLTEPVVHYLHETLWQRSPPPADDAQALHRVPIKTATYALANAGRVFTTAFILTGNPVVAVGMMAFNAVGDSVVYALNDGAWAHFRPVAAPAPLAGAAGAR